MSPLMRRLRPWIAVAAGGLIGSAGRTAAHHWMPASPDAFPTATLAVNLAGSLLIGFYLARRERTVTVPWSLPFWGIGILGSFTSSSAFSIEVIQLLEAQRALLAGGYVALSIVGGLALALVGQRIGSVIR